MVLDVALGRLVRASITKIGESKISKAPYVRQCVGEVVMLCWLGFAVRYEVLDREMGHRRYRLRRLLVADAASKVSQMLHPKSRSC